MNTKAWRDFLRKAFEQRPRITKATVTIGKSVVLVDWSGDRITANGKKDGEPMTWAEGDAWNVIHNLRVFSKSPVPE